MDHFYILTSQACLFFVLVDIFMFQSYNFTRWGLMTIFINEIHFRYLIALLRSLNRRTGVFDFFILISGVLARLVLELDLNSQMLQKVLPTLNNVFLLLVRLLQVFMTWFFYFIFLYIWINLEDILVMMSYFQMKVWVYKLFIKDS
jgi:hypothetical protein